MGWLSDFVSDPIGSVTSGLETAGNAIGDAGQYLGDTVGNAWQGTYNNIDNYAKAFTNELGQNYQFSGDVMQNALRDPFDINSYTDPAQRRLDQWNQEGDDLFGTGGWIKAGANTLSTGNPFQGAGSLAYQADAALSGGNYNNGATSGPATFSNLYNLGSDVYNSDSSGTVPTDSNTYQEALPGGGSTTVTPSDYYNSGATTASNVGNITQGNNVGDYQLPDNSYMNPDPGTLGTGTYGTGTQSPDTGGLGYGSYGVPGGENSIPGPQAPGLMEQLSGYLNSGYGKLGRAGLSILNPNLGAVANGLAGSANGNLGPAIDTLGSLYLNNRAAKANRQYQDQMNSQISQLSGLYSNNSPYAQQLRQELERKDAAAGRRSQYGGRETQLQAMLAEKQAGLDPMQKILTSQAMQNSIAQQQAARSRQFADLKSIFAPAKPGGQSQGSGAGLTADQTLSNIRNMLGL